MRFWLLVPVVLLIGICCAQQTLAPPPKPMFDAGCNPAEETGMGYFVPPLVYSGLMLSQCMTSFANELRCCIYRDDAQVHCMTLCDRLSAKTIDVSYFNCNTMQAEGPSAPVPMPEF